MNAPQPSLGIGGANAIGIGNQRGCRPAALEVSGVSCNDIQHRTNLSTVRAENLPPDRHGKRRPRHRALSDPAELTGIDQRLRHMALPQEDVRFTPGQGFACTVQAVDHDERHVSGRPAALRRVHDGYQV